MLLLGCVFLYVFCGLFFLFFFVFSCFARFEPYYNLDRRVPALSKRGLDLLNRMLTYDPKKRISIADALRHSYFCEDPVAMAPGLMPTFPDVRPEKQNLSQEKACTHHNDSQSGEGMYASQ